MENHEGSGENAVPLKLVVSSFASCVTELRHAALLMAPLLHFRFLQLSFQVSSYQGYADLIYPEPRQLDLHQRLKSKPLKLQPQHDDICKLFAFTLSLVVSI